MQILVVHNTKNSPKHGNDAGGAFIPEGVLFERHRKSLGDTVQRVGYDNLEMNRTKRAEQFLAIIDRAEPFDAFVYLGHGLRTWLPSPNVTQAMIPRFAKLLARKAKNPKKLIVTLFACSTGESPRKTQNGDNGFADLLRDRLEDEGVVEGHVDAHTIAAHATQNAFLRRFDMGPGSNIGGYMLVDPKDKTLWTAWHRRLHAKAAVDPFRYEFPYMTQAEVVAALTKG